MSVEPELPHEPTQGFPGDHTTRELDPFSLDESAGSSEPASDGEPPSRLQRIFKRIGWSTLAFFLLLFFTLLKLPDDRLKATIQGYLASALADQGISFTAAESHLSIGFGVSYEMRNVTLRPPAPAAPIQLDRLGVKPALLPLLFKKQGGKFWINAGQGELNGTFSIKGSSVAVSFDADKFELKRSLVAALTGSFAASLILDGSAELSGDFNNPSSLNGEMQLSIRKLLAEQQNVMGFAIPRLSVSDSKAELVIKEGKAQIKELRIGSDGASPPDDLRATITGQVTLARSFSASTLDLKTRFSFSPAVLQAFALMEALIAPGKQPDGSYAFQLSGPAYAPTPTPIPPK